MTLLPCLLAVCAMLVDAPAAPGQGSAPPLKVGIIGLDTSHVVAFTKLLNNPKAKGDLAGVRVVAAFPGGSPDIPSSRDRVAGLHRRRCATSTRSRSSIRSTPC